MTDLQIEQVKNKADIEAFVKFPMQLYANNKYFVPPIIKDETEI